MATDTNTTHEVRTVSATQMESLADRIFVAGLECRRDDFLVASALLRRLSLDGDVGELYVWKLQEAGHD